MAEASPKKKLPFKQTVKKRAAPSDLDKASDPGEDDSLNLFRRRQEMAPKLLEEQERRIQRRQKKAEEQRRREAEEEELKKQREDADRQAMDTILAPREDVIEKLPLDDPVLLDNSSGSGPADKGGSSRRSVHITITPPPSKRLRRTPSIPSSQRHASISVEDEDDTDGDGGDKSYRNPRIQASGGSTSTGNTPSSRRLRSKYGSFAAASSFTTTSAAISVDSDSDVGPFTPTPQKQGTSLPVPVDAGDDEEVAAHIDQPEEEDPGAKWEKLAEERRAQAAAQQARAEVEIMVTSAIEGTRPARFRFLFHKPLQIVRDSWCAMQRQKGITLPVPVDDVILTWKRKKVYMTDTLHVLGVKPKPGGKGFLLTEHTADGLTDDRTMIRMQIWTPELYGQMRTREEARKKKAMDGELSEDDDHDDSNDGESGEDGQRDDEPVRKLRVVLRAKNAKEVKLSARPETTVDTLVTAYRTQTDMDARSRIILMFDGEELEEHVTMAEAEIDDMDTIEVYIK